MLTLSLFAADNATNASLPQEVRQCPGVIGRQIAEGEHLESIVGHVCNFVSQRHFFDKSYQDLYSEQLESYPDLKHHEFALILLKTLTETNCSKRNLEKLKGIFAQESSYGDSVWNSEIHSLAMEILKRTVCSPLELGMAPILDAWNFLEVVTDHADNAEDRQKAVTRYIDSLSHGPQALSKAHIRKLFAVLTKCAESSDLARSAASVISTCPQVVAVLGGSQVTLEDQAAIFYRIRQELASPHISKSRDNVNRMIQDLSLFSAGDAQLWRDVLNCVARGNFEDLKKEAWLRWLECKQRFDQKELPGLWLEVLRLGKVCDPVVCLDLYCTSDFRELLRYGPLIDHEPRELHHLVLKGALEGCRQKQRQAALFMAYIRMFKAASTLMQEDDYKGMLEIAKSLLKGENRVGVDEYCAFMRCILENSNNRSIVEAVQDLLIKLVTAKFKGGKCAPVEPLLAVVASFKGKKGADATRLIQTLLDVSSTSAADKAFELLVEEVSVLKRNTSIKTTEKRKLYGDYLALLTRIVEKCNPEKVLILVQICDDHKAANTQAYEVISAFIKDLLTVKDVALPPYFYALMNRLLKTPDGTAESSDGQLEAIAFPALDPVAFACRHWNKLKGRTDLESLAISAMTERLCIDCERGGNFDAIFFGDRVGLLFETLTGISRTLKIFPPNDPRWKTPHLATVLKVLCNHPWKSSAASGEVVELVCGRLAMDEFKPVRMVDKMLAGVFMLISQGKEDVSQRPLLVRSMKVLLDDASMRSEISGLLVPGLLQGGKIEAVMNSVLKESLSQVQEAYMGQRSNAAERLSQLQNLLEMIFGSECFDSALKYAMWTRVYNVCINSNLLPVEQHASFGKELLYLIDNAVYQIAQTSKRDGLEKDDSFYFAPLRVYQQAVEGSLRTFQQYPNHHESLSLSILHMACALCRYVHVDCEIKQDLLKRVARVLSAIRNITRDQSLLLFTLASDAMVRGISYHYSFRQPDRRIKWVKLVPVIQHDDPFKVDPEKVSSLGRAFLLCHLIANGDAQELEFAASLLDYGQGAGVWTDDMSLFIEMFEKMIDSLSMRKDHLPTIFNSDVLRNLIYQLARPLLMDPRFLSVDLEWQGTSDRAVRTTAEQLRTKVLNLFTRDVGSIHAAASRLILKTFDTVLQLLEKGSKGDVSQFYIYNVFFFIVYLKVFFSSGLFTPQEQNVYIRRLLDLLEEIHKNSPKSLFPMLFEHVCEVVHLAGHIAYKDFSDSQRGGSDPQGVFKELLSLVERWLQFHYKVKEFADSTDNTFLDTYSALVREKYFKPCHRDPFGKLQLWAVACFEVYGRYLSSLPATTETAAAAPANE